MRRPLPSLAVTVLLLAGTALAFPRIPQVPVSGSALQNLLNAQAQAIDVQTQQQDVQRFQGMFVDKPPLSFGVRAIAGSGGLNLYDPPNAATMFALFPAATSTGWHTAVSFRESPTRVVVSLFDNNDSIVGTTTYLGVNGFQEGFVVTNGGTAYSEDLENPGGQPRMLFFKGTGARTTDVWLAADTDGNGDFADALFLLEFFAPVPARSTTWGRVKALYR